MPQLLKTIRAEMLKFPRNPDKYPTLALQTFEMVPSIGLKVMTCKSTIKGESGETYTTSVQFFNVNFNEQSSLEHTETATLRGKVWYYEKLNINKNPVAVKCMCQDYRFTWEYPLFQNKANIGNWRRYTPVQPPSGRPPRNPKNLMGYCKHIYSLLVAMNRSGRLIG